MSEKRYACKKCGAKYVGRNYANFCKLYGLQRINLNTLCKNGCFLLLDEEILAMAAQKINSHKKSCCLDCHLQLSLASSNDVITIERDETAIKRWFNVVEIAIEEEMVLTLTGD